MMRRLCRRACPLLIAFGLVACGGTPAAPHLGDNPMHYLVTIDQLVSPDFTQLTAPQSADAAALAGDDHALAAQSTKAGFEAGGTERFFRSISLNIANGPVDIVASAARFQSAAGAHTWYSTAINALAAVTGAGRVSTGPLGDEAGATTQLATASDGTVAVQITIAWRVANVVNTVVIRGRYGGTRLDDALYLARQQTANEIPGRS